MKYAEEVISLLGAFPGRDYKMSHIVRSVANGRPLSLKDRHRIRVGVATVLQALEEAGQILVKPPRAARGSYALYRWKA